MRSLDMEIFFESIYVRLDLEVPLNKKIRRLEISQNCSSIEPVLKYVYSGALI